MTTAAPRSLADALRAWPDERLARLLQLRPDLAVPIPSDARLLASRAASSLSVRRALENVDAHALSLLETLAASDQPVVLPDDEALTRLEDLALVWGGPEWHLVGSVRDVLTSGTGLGRPIAVLLADHTGERIALIAEALGAVGRDELLKRLTDPDSLRDLLEQAGPQARAIVAQLAAGPPFGKLKDARRVTPLDEVDSPVRWLLSRGLLVAIDDDTLELPREVALVARNAPEAARSEPPLTTTKVGVKDIDRAAAHEAALVVSLVEKLLESWAEDPPSVLRSGGLGVRDLKRAAKDLDVTEPAAALIIEIAYAAALLDHTPSLDPDWLPTPGYDRWLALPPEDRWLELARAYVHMTRMPALVGTRDERDKARAALSQDVERAGAPADRRRVLDLLRETKPGQAVSEDTVVSVLAWRAPRRGARLRDLIPSWVLGEIAALGLCGRGGLASYARLLLDGHDRDAARALRDLLPEPLDHVLVQPDLTVVAPGPLERDLARQIALVADVESTGGATVYRVTEATVRRALDNGRSAADLHELFRTRSRTPVPQGLSYLIDDVARRHGLLRVGTSASYLRCDDEALLTEVMASKRADVLGLRRIAPTVVTSAASINQVLEVLRGMGHAPAAEAPDGALLIARGDARRTPVRQRPTRHEPQPLPDEQARLAVGALRAGDLASRATRRPSVTVADSHAFLQQAAREGRQVWLSYVDAQGRPTSRVVEPRTVDGGYLTAYDHLRQEDRTFSLHRITEVAEVDAHE